MVSCSSMLTVTYVWFGKTNEIMRIECDCVGCQVDMMFVGSLKVGLEKGYKRRDGIDVLSNV